jgi:hypothetical protein
MSYKFNPFTGSFDDAGKVPVTVSATAPNNPVADDLWWDSTSGILFVYYSDGSSSQWVAANSGSVGFLPAGSTTQVQFNDDGALAGNAGLVFDKATGKLSALQAKIGGADDYANIGADGTVTLAGTATTFDDLMFPASAINPAGTANPAGVDNDHGWFLFDAAATETIAVQVQLPHRWKVGSTLYPHVHWHKTTAAAGNVLWRLEYKWADINAVMDAAWTSLDVVSTIAATPDTNTAQKHLISAWAGISTAGKGISAMLICRINRIGGDGTDTYGADAAMMQFDLHFEIDSFGSSQEYTK